MNYGDKTSITVIGQEIMESDKLEVLGVTIDCGLNFNLNIGDVCKKASQSVGVIIERLRFTFTPNCKRELAPRDQVFPLFFVYRLLLLHKNK